MAQALNNAQHDFWRPPVIQKVENTLPAEGTCAKCQTEFLVGARFCHSCGAARRTIQRRAQWDEILAFVRTIKLQKVQQYLGLPTLPLTAFLIGIGCLIGAVSVGFLYPTQHFSDFQAVQMWRMQWLLGAIAAFLAAILLKFAAPQQK